MFLEFDTIFGLLSVFKRVILPCLQNLPWMYVCLIHFLMSQSQECAYLIGMECLCVVSKCRTMFLVIFTDKIKMELWWKPPSCLCILDRNDRMQNQGLEWNVDACWRQFTAMLTSNDHRTDIMTLQLSVFVVAFKQLSGFFVTIA